MKAMKKKLDALSLKALLRQGDPAEPLSEEKAARVRRRLVVAVAESRQEDASAQRAGGWRWGWMTAAAGLGALALATWLLRGGPELPRPSAPVGGPPAAPAVLSTPRTQIDFATPGGTRIIWTLIPEPATERRNG
jgi:hypothetical protein